MYQKKIFLCSSLISIDDFTFSRTSWKSRPAVWSSQLRSLKRPLRGRCPGQTQWSRRRKKVLLSYSFQTNPPDRNRPLFSPYILPLLPKVGLKLWYAIYIFSLNWKMQCTALVFLISLNTLAYIRSNFPNSYLTQFNNYCYEKGCANPKYLCSLFKLSDN